MNNAVKLGLYIVLAIAALIFGLGFYSEFKRQNAEAQNVTAEAGETTQVSNTAPSANTTETNLTTNAVAEITNQIDPVTNAATNVDINQATNAVAAATNETVQATNVTASAADHSSSPPSAKRVGKGRMMTYLGAFLGVTIVLGLLIAYDVTQFFGNRSVDFLFNDDLKGVHNPEYEEAEALWANGKPLEAIQALREYLKKNPREQYVALRIAEIYEKDLHNYLAAALEYEQVLVHKLPRERWGWAAIHLCNLYSKLGKQDQCIALLRRIDSEYGETAAAGKARKRLAMYESMGDINSLGTDSVEDPHTGEAAPPLPKARVVAKTKAEEPPASNLPPGFRPK